MPTLEIPLLPISPLCPQPANASRFTHMRSGQAVDIRLHHPHTANHIGETLRAHYMSTSEIRFEVVKAPGKVLRVTDLGRVEFSACLPDDPTCRFRFELTLHDTVYLKCTAHQQKLNINGEVGWFLALSPEGQLMGNSHRGPQAQWSLVAEMNPYAVRPQPGPAQPLTASSSMQSRSIDGSIAQYPAALPPAPAAPAAKVSATPMASSSGAVGSALGSLNPFRSRASSAAAAPEAPDRVGANDELNPLLFQQAQAQHSVAPAPAAAAASSTGLTVLRSLPAFTAFAKTLAPQLLNSIEADPVGFVRAVQSPELWALLDALPPDFQQLAEAELTSSISSSNTNSSAGAACMSMSGSSSNTILNTTHYNVGGESSGSAMRPQSSGSYATLAAFDAFDPFADSTREGVAMTTAVAADKSRGNDGPGEEDDNLKIRPVKRVTPSRGPAFAKAGPLSPPPTNLLDDLEL